jgi:hypothetical protein
MHPQAPIKQRSSATGHDQRPYATSTATELPVDWLSSQKAYRILLLMNVVGRKAGTVEGFRYSDGLKAAGWIWTPEKIDEWITFPKKMIRDTFMNYRQSDPAIRKAIIAYLATQKD